MEKTPAVTALTGFIRPGESRLFQRDKKPAGVSGPDVSGG